MPTGVQNHPRVMWESLLRGDCRGQVRWLSGSYQDEVAPRQGLHTWDIGSFE
jgi:hypothetical protein